MKMSSEPSFGAPGGYIFDVVAQGLKNISFTAKNGHGVPQKYYLTVYYFVFLNQFTFCVQGNEALAKK